MKLVLKELDFEIQKLYSRFCEEHAESLRQFLSDSPTQYSDVFLHYDLTQIVIGSKKKRDLIALAILSWYFPEEIRILVQLSLKEHWQEQDCYSIEKEVLLSSKAICLAWILKESNWNEFDFFGNVLNRKTCTNLVSRLNFLKLSRKKVKRYTGYCRGYRESNRGAPSSVPPELRKGVLDQQVLELKELNYHIQVHNCLRRCSEYLSQVS
jgi:hypothetical protein